MSYVFIPYITYSIYRGGGGGGNVILLSDMNYIIHLCVIPHLTSRNS